MKLKIFEADIEDDKDIIKSILDQNREYKIDEKRYEWLYLNNPFGRARSWIIKDEEIDQIIGAAAAYPRLIWVKGKMIQCHVLADFSVNHEYRSLGPAIKLNRASLMPVYDGMVPFAYDFPSQTMAAAHRWSKVYPIGEMIRLVRPLQVRSKIGRIPLIRKEPIKTIINTLAKGVLNLIPPYKTDRTFSFECEMITENTFDKEFEQLDNKIGPSFPVCGSRNPKYLKWRYGQNPLRRFRIIKLLKEDNFCGYAIFCLHDDDNRIHIYDLYSYDFQNVKKSLIYFLLHTARKDDIETIHFALLESNPWVTNLKKYGFVSRPPPADVFIFLSKSSPLNGVVNIADNWYMTMGDRDT